MKRSNKVAVALGLQDTAATLEMLDKLSAYIGLAEIRLDLMDEFDLEQIITAAPCPLVITCRPRREGGSYNGDEKDRLAILTRASELNCAYIDVEWDSVSSFINNGASTRVIASRHYYDTEVEEAWEQYQHLRPLADAVKLVGSAEHVSDALPMLELMTTATTPLIAIAMGAAGLVTRMLAPCFKACLLTYGAVSQDLATAPGQISVQEMVNRYALDRVSSETRVQVYLYSNREDEPEVQSNCGGSDRGLNIAVHVEQNELEAVAQRLEALSPHISAIPFAPA